MPRKRQVLDIEQSAVSVEENQESSPVASTAVTGAAKDKIYITLDENGLVDVDSMRTKSKAKLCEFLVNPENAKRLGISADKALGFKPSRDFINGCFGLLGNIFALGGHYGLKLEPLACQQLAFTKDDVDKLFEPTAAVIAKYAPSKLINNQELATFGIVLADVLKAKVICAYLMQQQLLQAKQNSTPTVETPVVSDAASA